MMTKESLRISMMLLFGLFMVAALSAQKRVGLTNDGVCGCNTWKKLSAAVVGIGRTKTVLD